jgi:hypothetical protein
VDAALFHRVEKRLRAYLQSIWDAPTPWEIEQAKEAEEAKAKAEVAAAPEGKHRRVRVRASTGEILTAAAIV